MAFCIGPSRSSSWTATVRSFFRSDTPKSTIRAGFGGTPAAAILGRARRRSKVRAGGFSRRSGCAPNSHALSGSAYAVTFDNGLCENEIVNVYVGPLAGELRPHSDEVVDLASMTLDDLAHALARDPAAYAYWLHHYLRHHRQALEQALASAADQARLPEIS